eukprot:TRINITY_DN114771_c0_g1_i1.p2 TRINITY_DN114771_c0_g1~~TRINITY_DN114771_c0_g1_i1.p2  ORF type:complete len:281 (+),score=89.11 TRINITY_DN114771_c0_g1_i1:60-902(+)
MGWKRRKEKEDRVISFDAVSRHSYLSGFRKRKGERRKLAVREIIEKERQDKIEAKKDFRDDVKKRWKDLQRAEKRVDAVLGLGDAEREEILIIGGDRRDAIADGKAPVTIAFEKEDDDPFGDCEVTTTIGGISTASGGHLPLSVIDKQTGTLALLRNGAGLLRDLTGMPEEDPKEKTKRRIAASIRQEELRQIALDRNVKKKIEFKERGGVKKDKVKKKSGGGPGGKTTAKERRKRMKKVQKRGGGKKKSGGGPGGKTTAKERRKRMKKVQKRGGGKKKR